MLMVIWLGVVASVIATLIMKAADNKVTALFEVIKEKPYETVVLLCLCIIMVGVWMLAFLQG